MIDLYWSETEFDHKRIGFCYIFASNMKETAGICSMNFTGDTGRPVAHLNSNYVLFQNSCYHLVLNEVLIPLKWNIL